MNPEGRLVRSRVVSGAGPVLEDALDRRLTGYAVLAPRDALLGDGEARGILTFEDGVPALAYHTADRAGPDALAALATPGPYRLELYELPPGAFDGSPVTDDRRVPPAMPAERLAGDPALADRTRRLAPAEWLHDSDPTDGTAGEDGEDRADGASGEDGEDRADGADDDAPGGPDSAVEAFLADEERVEAIRERARAEARRRASEWGFEDAI